MIFFRVFSSLGFFLFLHAFCCFGSLPQDNNVLANALSHSRSLSLSLSSISILSTGVCICVFVQCTPFHECDMWLCVCWLLCRFCENGFVDGILPLFLWIVFYLKSHCHKRNSKVTMVLCRTPLRFAIFVYICRFVQTILYFHPNLCSRIPHSIPLLFDVTIVYLFISFHSLSLSFACSSFSCSVRHENCISNLMLWCKRSFGVVFLCEHVHGF